MQEAIVAYKKVSFEEGGGSDVFLVAAVLAEGEEALVAVVRLGEEGELGATGFAVFSLLVSHPVDFFYTFVAHSHWRLWIYFHKKKFPLRTRLANEVPTRPLEIFFFGRCKKV